MERVTVETYYLTEDGESHKGPFELRRLTVDEASSLYDLCQRRNPKTGMVLGNDEMKYSKLKLAMAITGCPLVYQNTAWKDMGDLQMKGAALGKLMDETEFVKLHEALASIKRFDDKTANL